MSRLTPLVLLAALVVASTGRADVFITGTESANQTALGGTPNLTGVNRVNGTTLGGWDFGNDVTQNTMAPVAGDKFNILSVDQITSYNQVGGGAPLAGFAPNTVTIVTATRGTILPGSGGGVVNVAFDKSVSAFYVTPSAGYNPQHPATWGATDATGTTFNTPKALYSLHAPLAVIPGPGGQGDSFAGTVPPMNSSTINIGSPVQSQGRILVSEVNNGGFLVVNPAPGATGVGQFGQFNQQFQTGTLPTLSTADQNAMNTIFNKLLGAGSSPETGDLFATFGSGTAGDFQPDAAASKGDGELSFGVAFDPGSFLAAPPAVPEPTTFAAWALLLGSGGIGGTIRYYRSKWARKA